MMSHGDYSVEETDMEVEDSSLPANNAQTPSL